eukprot:14095720-Alexandrium_andersonii.AAC.1
MVRTTIAEQVFLNLRNPVFTDCGMWISQSAFFVVTVLVHAADRPDSIVLSAQGHSQRLLPALSTPVHYQWAVSISRAKRPA